MSAVSLKEIDFAPMDSGSISSMTTGISVLGTSIGSYAFYRCTILTSVSIPGGVTSIGQSAFQGCPSLSAITVDASNPAYSSADGVLFDKGQTTLIQCSGAKAGSYTIPSGVTSIGSSAFDSCKNLTSVSIPSGVTSIGSSAFSSCTGLTSVSIPSSVTSIGNYAFISCTSLTSVSIASGVTSIGTEVFAFCTSLTSVSIPSSVTSIGSDAFEYCTNLTSVSIPSGVTSIGIFAFAYCVNLKSAVFLGNAPRMTAIVFGGTPSDFTIYYFDGATGFSSSPWTGYTTVDMGASSPIPPWLITNGFAYNADLTSKPNNDGVPLLMSYALNLDPTKNQSATIPKPVISGSQMSLTYYAGSSGIAYSVEVSTDLQSWSTSGVTVSVPDTNSFCTATVPVTGSNCFMRLKVVY